MSIDMKMGVRSRKIMTIMAAVFAVALMIAVPVLTAAGTEADLTEASAGFAIDTTDPTDAQMTKLNNRKYDVIRFALSNEMSIFSYTTLGAPTTVTMDSFAYQHAEGEKVTKDQDQDFTSLNVKAENVFIEYTVAAAGSLFSSETYMSASEKEVKKAIVALIGGENLAAGDKVSIAGFVKQEMAMDGFLDYKLLAGDKCVYSKTSESTYVLDDVDLTMKITKAGSTAKELKITSNLKGMNTDTYLYEYKSDDVQVGTAYTLKNEVSTVLSGNIRYEIGEKEYPLDYKQDQGSTTEKTVIASDIFDQSDITISAYLTTKIAGLPASEEGMKVDKTFDAASSMYGGVIMDVVGDDLLKVLLIAGGVIIAIVVLIAILIIILVVRKSKKA